MVNSAETAEATGKVSHILSVPESAQSWPAYWRVQRRAVSTRVRRGRRKGRGTIRRGRCDGISHIASVRETVVRERCVSETCETNKDWSCLAAPAAAAAVPHLRTPSENCRSKKQSFDLTSFPAKILLCSMTTQGSAETELTVSPPIILSEVKSDRLSSIMRRTMKKTFPLILFLFYSARSL